MLKRNDIVYSKHDTMNAPYGRVNRIFQDGKVETIDSGKYIRVQDPNDLVIVTDYKGYWGSKFDLDLEESINTRFIRMPTLRRLKQMAARYDKTVWKKNRKGLFCEHTRFMVPYKDGSR